MIVGTPRNTIDCSAQRIGYLTNQYPAISHTFIRREIHALERSGMKIDRFSIRRARSNVVDAIDQLEQDRTYTLLDHPFAMLGSLLWVLIRHPIGFCRALRSAVRSALKTPAGWKQFVYLVESCLLAQICTRRRIGHLHVHHATNPCAVARLCGMIAGLGYSMSIHGPDEWLDPEGIELRAKVAECRFVCCISEYTAGKLRSMITPDDEHKIQLIRCGIDDAFFEQSVPMIRDCMQFVCIGRLCEAKAHRVLIDAFRIVTDSFPHATLTLCGDGELRTELENQIRHQGLSESITLTGWATQQMIIEHLKRSRALVLSSDDEGLPVVLMEAMAMGRAVISTAVAGIPELVQHSENGWLIKANDPEALADAMIECLTMTDENLGEMGNAGRELVRSLHSIDRCIDPLRTALCNCFAVN